MDDESGFEWDSATNAKDSLGADPQGPSKGKAKDDGPSSKRRCVSSACIACRKRKSKVRQSSLKHETAADSMETSAMEIYPAVLPAHQSIIPHVCTVCWPYSWLVAYMTEQVYTTQTRTTVGRASTRKILTIYEPEILPCKH